MRRRTFAIAAAMVVALSAAASAQTYPDKPVRMIVAFGAGGTLDTLARIVSQKLSEMWGQQVVVENRAGAGGNIGAAQASQAAPGRLHAAFRRADAGRERDHRSRTRVSIPCAISSRWCSSAPRRTC